MLPYFHDSSASDEDEGDKVIPPPQRSRINPFDDSFSSSENDVFYDAQEAEQQVVGPLEAALMEYADWSDDCDHSQPDNLSLHRNFLTRSIQTHLPSYGSDAELGTINRRRPILSRRLSTQPQAPRVRLESTVLSKLDSNPLETTASTPWIKLILLEELGTASSWVVLLLPYFAFMLCLLLDSYSSAEHIGPLNATSTCQNTTATPMFQMMDKSCTHSFSLTSDSLSTSQWYQQIMKRGIAFTSSPIPTIPPMSSFLRGDARYSNITSPVVALVARGMIFTSTVLMQLNENQMWIPLSVSAPEQLSMACVVAEDTADGKGFRNEDSVPLSIASTWDCTSPRIVDVLFSMPGTAVLSGRPLQVNVLYAFQKFPNEIKSMVYAEGVNDLFRNYVINIDDSEVLLETIVSHSTYTLEHASPSHESLNIFVRLLAWVVTMLFMGRWCQRMGVKGFLGLSDHGCCWLNGGWWLWAWFRQNHEEEALLNKDKHRRAMTAFWWESPWILFPERRYLLLLMLSLMLVQNPFLIYAYFHPQLYSNPNFHTLVDAMIGIGVNFNFMLWLCIFQGLRYHTATVNRRRARQQQQVLEFQRTAKYIAKADVTFNGNEEEFIDRYTQEYFDTYGDIDGTGSSETLDVRLKSDPCGDSWADFLFSKCVLLLIGVSAVIVCSSYRFSANAALVSPRVLEHYNTIYVCGSFIELFVIFFWVFLLLRQAIRTGSKLRKEPFLSTRPAQLAYRILLGILFLTLGSIFVPIFADMYYFISKWSLHGRDQGNERDSSSSTIDILLKVILHVSERIPFIGAAAFYGPGKVLFGTVTTLLAAFIFLPSRSFSDPDDPWLIGRNKDKVHEVTEPNDNMFSNLNLTDFGRRNKDKRLMVTLARYTHTWRIMPLPIKKVNSNLLSDLSFHLDTSDSSIAFFGKYTAVFCLEIACWLLEASWQAYYSPTDFSSDSFAPGRMSLDSIGLHLEKAIFDEETLTQAYISTNMNAQVDGPEDSIIVVAFRGTANVQNMRMDLKLRQIPLLDQIIGLGDPMFQVHVDGVSASYTNTWFYDFPVKQPSKLKSYTPSGCNTWDGCIAFPLRVEKQSAVTAVSLGAKAVLKATPMAKQTLPCVHQGFQEAYSHMREEVWNSLLGILQRQLAKSVERSRQDHEYGHKEPLCLPKIYITGHSLGGSIAQLLALDLASNCELNFQLDDPMNSKQDCDDSSFHIPLDTPTRSGPDSVYSPYRPTCTNAHRETREPIKLRPPIAVYTYGQPRVGNHAFARLYKQRVPHTFRVATEGDAITTTPTAMMCGGWYKHAGLEVMLDEGLTGNILVGPTVVETMFRFTKMRTSLVAHSLETYRDSLESGLSQDELQEYYRTRGTTTTKDSKKRAKMNQPIHQNLPEWLTTVKIRRSFLDS